jgi:hypothetical protein
VPAADDHALARAHAAILAEARAQVALGREPDTQALAARIRAATEREGAAGAAESSSAERRALQQLERVVAVHRARAAVTREPAPPPAQAPRVVPATRPRRAVLRTRPTITGNMEVRRQGDATLAWDTTAAVVEWEVRVSERADARSDYAVIETRTLPGEATSADLPLGEQTLRVHLLGRARDGRLLRRAVISALTRETWGDRWQRKASAS